VIAVHIYRERDWQFAEWMKVSDYLSPVLVIADWPRIMINQLVEEMSESYGKPFEPEPWLTQWMSTWHLFMMVDCQIIILEWCLYW
jgi:hypothetical protein